MLKQKLLASLGRALTRLSECVYINIFIQIRNVLLEYIPGYRRLPHVLRDSSAMQASVLLLSNETQLDVCPSAFSCLQALCL